MGNSLRKHLPCKRQRYSNGDRHQKHMRPANQPQPPPFLVCPFALPDKPQISQHRLFLDLKLKHSCLAKWMNSKVVAVRYAPAAQNQQFPNHFSQTFLAAIQVGGAEGYSESILVAAV